MSQTPFGLIVFGGLVVMGALMVAALWHLMVKVEKTKPKTLKLLDAAAMLALKSRATQGEREAQFDLACALFDGRGGEENEAEALVQLKAAAQGGHGAAQRMYGQLHLNGLVVPVDRVEAYLWTQRAVKAGAAQEAELSAIEKVMTPEELARAQASALTDEARYGPNPSGEPKDVVPPPEHK